MLDITSVVSSVNNVAGNRSRRYRSPVAFLFIALCLVLITAHLTPIAEAAPQSLTLQVKASADDARTSDCCGMIVVEPMILVGAGDGTHPNIAGFRFSGLTLPSGAVVDGANLSLLKRGSQWQALSVDLAFEAAGNAATFSTTRTPAQRTLTTTHSVVNVNQYWTDNTRYTVGDPTQLGASLRQVLTRSDWRAGNAVALIATGAPTPAWGRAGFAAFDNNAANAAQLVITYHLQTQTATPTSTTRANTPMPTMMPTSTATPRANTPTPTQTPPAGTPQPVAGQPCPAWVHDRYVATGPDGKTYPTWHPAIDPQYGCDFGHEHGDNPAGSPALRGYTLPFGYVGLSVGEVEAHTGFKVYRWDNIQGGSNGPNHDGASLLILFHQGTSSDNAFTQAFHEIQIHYYNPRDGREVHVQMLAPFGNLAIGCGANDPNLLRIQQANVPGLREIPGPQCFGAALKNGSGTIAGSIPYEDWLTALYVGGDGQGHWKGYIDPHFAVFNPNRYCQPNAPFTAASPCTLGRSDTRANTGADPAGTGSEYKGTKREAYLNQVLIDNANGPATFTTDAHGLLVPAGTPGAIKQFLSTVRVMPIENSIVFDSDHDQDQGGTVHAPN